MATKNNKYQINKRVTIILLKKGIVQQINLQQGQETYIATGYQYHYWNGFLIPYLIIKTEDSATYFPFIGPKYLFLSNNTYCTSCLKPTERSTWIGWCDDCKDQEENKKFSCIFTKAGEPFGMPCDPSTHSVCNDETFRNHFCAGEYVLYLGRIGAKMKCGITRKRRGGYPQGYRFRIMSQGFDEVHVFQGLTPIHLAWAQELEQDITRFLSISQFLTFQEKFQEITNFECFTRSDTFDELITLIEDAFPELQLLKSLYFNSDYWIHPETELLLQTSRTKLPIIHNPTEITGEIYLARGEVVLVNEGEKAYWINLRELQGYAYLHHEE